jgi:uncharacterized membrane protein
VNVRWSHTVFALTMIALGILGLVKGDFAPIWLPVSDSVPGRQALAYLCALVSLAAGAGLLWRRTAAIAARVWLALLLGWLLVVRLPNIVVSPTIDVIWAAAEVAAIVGAAWVVCNERSNIARALYGAALLPFGVAHFLYLQQTVVLVPASLPWPTGWAYLTGGAFVAAGVAVLSGVWARLAAALSAAEIGLFTLIVWVPVIARGGASAFDWHESVASWVLTSAAWVVAESYRGTPWLAVGKR